MLHYLLLLVLASLSRADVTSKSQCLSDARTGSCDFYDCWEAEAHCGPSGYPEGYGGKYCRRFALTAHYFNAKGQDWIDCVRVCLTNTSLKWYESNTMSCAEITTTEFNLHPQCYLGCGFCSMAASARNLYGLVKTFDLKDFFSVRAIKQVYQVLSACLKG